MKYRLEDIGGEVVKDNDVYVLKDNTELKNLVVSSTLLHREKSTRGHSHEGQEEVYTFVYGYGEMELDGKRFPVRTGDVVLIHDGVFHRVHNTSDGDLYFVCVFQGKRNH
jgi:mannose-6-phosphate isomerase-like protein (cupin superfamily)